MSSGGSYFAKKKQLVWTEWRLLGIRKGIIGILGKFLLIYFISDQSYIVVIRFKFGMTQFELKEFEGGRTSLIPKSVINSTIN